jgi:hypothetical protein
MLHKSRDISPATSGFSLEKIGFQRSLGDEHSDYIRDLTFCQSQFLAQSHEGGTI